MAVKAKDYRRIKGGDEQAQHRPVAHAAVILELALVAQPLTRSTAVTMSLPGVRMAHTIRICAHSHPLL
jgi:hypothetical protein